MYFPKQLYLSIFCTTLCCSIANAQNNHSALWDNVKKTPQQGQKKVQKTGSSLKKFKTHLEKWGLDSNYNHGLAIGARLNSTGWTGLIYYQRRISRTQSHFFQLAFSEIKHEKQIRQQRNNTTYLELGNASPFIFGKINNVYQVQLGHGREMLLLPGLLEGNLSISLRLQAGFSLAMLKPYYLKLIYIDYTPDEHAYVLEEKYTAANQEQFLKAGSILGAAKWKKGLNEMTYLPGGYADAAIVIEPLKNKTFIKTVTLGCQFTMQSGKLEIMAHQKSYPWNACLYAGLQLGKRWK